MNNRLTFAVFGGLMASLLAGPAGADRIEQGNLIIDGIPEIPAAVGERLRQYQNTRAASFIGWDPSGNGILVSTRFGEVSQVHKVSAPGAARRQVTFYDEPVVAASYPSKEGVGGFVFQRDVGGAEDYQIFFFDEATGQARLLTDGESRNSSAIWSTDGSRIAFQSNRRDGRNWDILTVSPDDPSTTETVYRGEGYWLPLDYSPDDRKLAILKYRSITDSTLVVIDLEDGSEVQIGPEGQTAFYGQAEFTADGAGLFMISNLNSEFRTLRHVDFASGEIHTISGHIPWDVSGFDLSPDGRTLAYITNESGLSRLHLVDTERHEPLPGPDMPVAVVGGLEFSPDGSRLAMTINRAVSPSDVYVYGLASGTLERWTESEVGGLDTDKFADATHFTYPTFDQVDGEPRQIPAFITRPKGQGPHPVIISIHGGPEGQARPTWSSTTQFWSEELGAAVIRPNVRGSAGYGTKYVMLDNGFKREDSVRDIGALLDWIATQPDLDESRVIVFGGSYGGYMVLASMVHYNDRLLGAVDIVGISNFVTFLENTRAYRRDLRRAEYGDERDPEMRAHLERISPNNHTDKITKSMLIIQGVNDPRVPVGESEQMLSALRANGTEAWYLAAKDEGHGFRKKSNRDFQAAVTAVFLEKMLAPALY